MKIQDSVALVTGANRGLGLAIACELLARGAKKVYAGVRDTSQASTQLSGLVLVKLDVTDQDSVATAAAQCRDVSLLVNNAGIAKAMESILDPALIESAREIFETNFYGLIRMTQAFAPLICAKTGGAIVNVLSDANWFSRPMLSPYSASKSAAWSFTNALRVEMREKGTQVLDLHVGFMNTDMTMGSGLKKPSAEEVATRTLDALESGKQEVVGDEGTKGIKQGLSTDLPPDLNLSPFG